MTKLTISEVVASVERIVHGDTPEDADRIGRAFAPRGTPATPSAEVRFDTRVVDVDDTPATRALARALVAWLSSTRGSRRAGPAARVATRAVAPIIAEGDSWFDLPTIKLFGLPLYHGLDIPAVLKDELGYPVESEAHWGDTLASIFSEKIYLERLRQSGARLLLLCGGGNDLLGGGHLFDLLNMFVQERPVRDYLNQQYVSEKRAIRRTYRQIMEEVRELDPAIRILVHGYGYAIPNLASQNPGFWIGEPMLQRGIDKPDLARAIVRMMIDDHNETLSALASEPRSNLVHVDLRLLFQDSDWWDELHLRPNALRRAGARLAESIDALEAAVA